MSGEESRIEGSGVRNKGKCRNKKQKGALGEQNEDARGGGGVWGGVRHTSSGVIAREASGGPYVGLAANSPLHIRPPHVICNMTRHFMAHGLIQ